MTKSMTGFASVQVEGELGVLSIELKSVNSRYLDLIFKMPESIRAFEHTMRKQIGKKVTRGKLDCSVRFYPKVSDTLSVNSDYANALVASALELTKAHGIKNISVGELFRMPNVLVEKSPKSELVEPWFLKNFEQAIEQLIEQRLSEGQHLNNIIKERLVLIKKIVSEASENYQQSTQAVKENLQRKLNEISEKHGESIDQSRFEQEMIYYLQKMDIAEEIDRLNGHVVEVEKLLCLNEPVGRKLDFLMQEMNRESNTISSKSQHLGLTMNSVDLKVLLEQIREQIQNIE